MKSTCLLFFMALLILGKTTTGQTVGFHGVVQDSLNVPITYANVIAVDTIKNTITAFSVTNERGQFRLSLEENKIYRLKVSFVGFKPFESLIKAIDNSKTPLFIKLEENVQQLDGVEVVHEMPVLISGDTIIYKTDAFTDGNERKLEDVLGKLPGFEVDENGEVKVQGKRVDKLLVEGKEFFDGNTKMATKNLPANAIDKVEVLQNFNDVGPMSGLQNDEQLALNIRLKEDKKRMVFGDLTAGGGLEERYLGHANLFYYDPKTNVNVIGDLNNIGEQVFSIQDYYRFGGGLSGFSRRSGSSFTISRDDAGLVMSQRNSAQSLENKVGALNYNLTPTNKWRFTGSVIGSLADNRLGSISQRTYIQASGDNQELLSTNSAIENRMLTAKFSTRYTPSPALQIDYAAFIKTEDLKSTNIQTSVFPGFTNEIGNITTQTPFSLEQQLQAFYAKGEKNVFSFQVSHQYKTQDPLYDLMTTQRPFVSLIPVADSDVYNLLQYKDITTNKQESAFNYYRIINKTNHINFSVGNSYSMQSMLSNINQKIEGEDDQTFGATNLNNDVDFTFSDIYFGVSYKTKLSNLVLSPGATFHKYNFVNNQLDTESKVEKTLVLPNLFAKYNFRSTHSLTFNYSAQAEFTDIQNIASGLIIQNYNSLFSGNRGLENSWYHNLSLNYTNFNLYNFFNIFGNVSYQKRFDGITNTIQFNGLERISSPINIGVANELLSGSLNADKTFDDFRISGSARISESKNNNQISDITSENISLNQSYRGSIETTFFKKLWIQAGFEKSYNQYKANSVDNSFVTDRPFAKMKYPFLNGFILEADYEYNNYQGKNSNVNSSYDLLNANLSYRKKGSPWEFKISGMNLMNTTSIRRDSFSESLISTFEYFIQKRYYLFSVKYDL